MIQLDPLHGYVSRLSGAWHLRQAQGSFHWELEAESCDEATAAFVSEKGGGNKKGV